ncbi:CST complex subunit Ten1 [Apodospora peruviana]|uniref:CST complex subunit Ten1 n=1 Tax=Apodospora peruviana TaxID=516989 RepID=A0AAE0MC48_9PEZI|nr:CST complex subunit Ten1 [Apodospora peruviana]
MSNGPLPSQLCLLSDLPSKAVGDKVRFLACVTSYSPTSGVVTLEHHRPKDVCFVHAFVDVNLVLEGLKSDQTRTGEWVNVIGYITRISPLTDEKPNSGDAAVRIQALLLWSAGPLDVTRYETSVKVLKE